MKCVFWMCVKYKNILGNVFLPDSVCFVSCKWLFFKQIEAKARKNVTLWKSNWYTSSIIMFKLIVVIWIDALKKMVAIQIVCMYLTLYMESLLHLYWRYWARIHRTSTNNLCHFLVCFLIHKNGIEWFSLKIF